MKLLGLKQSLVRGPGDALAIRSEQEVPDDFVKRIQDERDARKAAPHMEWALAFRIPVAVVKKWHAEGFNIYDDDVTPEDIAARLQREDMNGLIAYT